VPPTTSNRPPGLVSVKPNATRARIGRTSSGFKVMMFTTPRNASAP
jgi:hypothetical protein